MPNVGDLVAGKFVVERLIGQGGMGAVFAARHRELESVVAIKVMLADTTNVEATARFKNEGRAAAKIRSEHVVRVEDVGEEKGYAYMILELLDGEDLAQVLERKRKLPAPEVIGYMMQALEGVRLAHEKGIIHRDLKPSNLFLARRDDGSSVVKVLDFGISKSSSTLAQAPGALTSTKAMLGSPLYMSPEQLRSSKSVDVRADIWALGVIMYELLTGTLPFMGDSLGELFAAILETEPTPVRVRAPDVPPELEAIVMRCLQRRLENRFSSVVELTGALMPFAAGAMSGANLPFGPGRTKMMSDPGVVSSAMAHAQGHSQAQPQGQGGTGAHQAHMPYGAPVGSSTGSAANIPVVKGTVPIGAITPQPNQTNGGLSQSWQTTSAGSKSRTAFVGAIAACGLMVVIGLGLAGVALRRNHDAHDTSTTGASGAPSSASPSALATTPTAPVPPPVESAVVPPATAAVSAAPAASSAVVPVSAPAQTASKPSTVTKPKEPVAKVEPKPAEPAKTAEPAKPKTSTSKPAAGGAETSR